MQYLSGYILPKTYHIERTAPDVYIGPLSEVQKSMLETLGYSGPMNVYQIAGNTRTRRRRERKTSQYYPVAHKAVKNLRQRGLVEIVRREKGKKGATTVVYDLTKVGMLRLIGEVEQLDFNRLAKNQAGKGRDVFLDRWDFLKSKNLAHAAEAMLRFQARELFLQRLLQKTKGEVSLDPKEYPMEYVTKAFKRHVSDEEYSRLSYIPLFDDELAKFIIKAQEDLVNQRQQAWLEAGLTLARSVYVQRMIEKSRKAGKPDDHIEQDVLKFVQSLNEERMQEVLNELGIELPPALQSEQRASTISQPS